MESVTTDTESKNSALDSELYFYNSTDPIELSRVMIDLFNRERDSFFKRIHASQGKVIIIRNEAAMAYSLIKDTLKYENFSGINTYIASDTDNVSSFKDVEYEVPENNMRDFTLLELFIAVYNKIKNKEIAYKIICRLID